MSITIEQVDYERKFVLRHLIELYSYDFSELRLVYMIISI